MAVYCRYAASVFIIANRRIIMAQKTTASLRPATDRVRRPNPANIVDWKRILSGTMQQETKPKPKPGIKQGGRATAQRIPKKPETSSLVFIKKEPATFQLSRLENPESFERMAFVIKACSKDPRRAHLGVLHVEQTRTGSRLVATDGLRLHVAEIAVKLPSGDYKPLLTKDAAGLGKPVTNIAFPNWKRVVPENIRKRGVINLEASGWGKNQNRTEALSRAFNAFLRQTGELVNLRFFEDLTKKQWSIYCQPERGKAILLREDGARQDIFAVVMPLPQTDAGSQAA
jgi:hypothetical protein